MTIHRGEHQRLSRSKAEFIICTAPCGDVDQRFPNQVPFSRELPRLRLRLRLEGAGRAGKARGSAGRQAHAHTFSAFGGPICPAHTGSLGTATSPLRTRPAGVTNLPASAPRHFVNALVIHLNTGEQAWTAPHSPHFHSIKLRCCSVTASTSRGHLKDKGTRLP